MADREAQLRSNRALSLFPQPNGMTRISTIAGVIAFFLGVDAERTSLETIEQPLSVVDSGGRGDASKS